MMFDVASGSGTVGGGGLPKRKVTNGIEGVPNSFVMSGGFPMLEGIARGQSSDRVGARLDQRRDVVVCVPPMDQMFG